MLKKTTSILAVIVALTAGVPLLAGGGGGPGGGGFGGGGPGGGGFGGGGPGGGGFGGGGGGPGGGGFGGGGPGGFGGGFDPAAEGGFGGGAGGFGGGGAGGFGGGADGFGGQATDMNARMIQSTVSRVQYMLDYPDGNEWTVLSMRIQKVLEDLTKLSAGAQNPLQTTNFGGGGGGRGGRGGGGTMVETVDATNPLAVARDTLLKGLGAENTEDELKAKLVTLREHHKKLLDELHTDREALRRLLLIRQEAILINMGVLD